MKSNSLTHPIIVVLNNWLVQPGLLAPDVAVAAEFQLIDPGIRLATPR
jgi:hypothetical protein